MIFKKMECTAKKFRSRLVIKEAKKTQFCYFAFYEKLFHVFSLRFGFFKFQTLQTDSYMYSVVSEISCRTQSTEAVQNLADILIKFLRLTIIFSDWNWLDKSSDDGWDFATKYGWPRKVIGRSSEHCQNPGISNEKMPWQGQTYGWLETCLKHAK